MRGALAWLGTVSFALGGCAATSRSTVDRAGDFAGGNDSPLRIVTERAVDSRVNPMVPLHLASDGGAIAVTFGERGRQEVVTRLDPASLALLSREPTGRLEALSAPATGAARVELDGGRALVCWTRESADGGRQVLAQLWSAGGSRLGTPVAVSPPDADVLGAPRVATTDGRHVLVTFMESSGESFELRAVLLEDAQRTSDSDRMVRR